MKISLKKVEKTFIEKVKNEKIIYDEISLIFLDGEREMFAVPIKSVYKDNKKMFGYLVDEYIKKKGE